MKYSGTPTDDHFAGRKRKVKISLNDSFSVMDLIRAIPDAKDIDNAAAVAVERLCDHGERYAKMIVPEDTGELKRSITHSVDVQGHKIHGEITAGTDHALFVEFGTGVVGQGTYPGDASGWQYNVPSPYKDEEGGWYAGTRYTKGMEARAYMYETAKEIENNAKNILKG